MTEDQMMEAAIGRIDERAAALAAFYKLPGLEYLASMAVTLDGAFDVSLALLGGNSEEHDQMVADLFAEAYEAAMNAGLKMCEAPQDKREAILHDIVGIVRERRDLQDKLSTGGEE